MSDDLREINQKLHCIDLYPSLGHKPQCNKCKVRSNKSLQMYSAIISKKYPQKCDLDHLGSS